MLIDRFRRYVKAVFRSYIDAKFSHGRNKQEVGWKLETLEQEVSDPKPSRLDESDRRSAQRTSYPASPRPSTPFEQSTVYRLRELYRDPSPRLRAPPPPMDPLDVAKQTPLRRAVQPRHPSTGRVARARNHNARPSLYLPSSRCDPQRKKATSHLLPLTQGKIQNPSKHGSFKNDSPPRPKPLVPCRQALLSQMSPLLPARPTRSRNPPDVPLRPQPSRTIPTWRECGRRVSTRRQRG